MIPAFIVPTMMHYDLLQNMLNSIDADIDHLIVIDNGGKLSGVICERAKQITVVSSPCNLGVATSWNLGIKMSPFSKWWLISNDDILWNSGKLEMVASQIEDRTIVADWNPLSAFSGFAIDEKTIASVGLFDEFYYPGCGEETNYWRRANAKGISGIHIQDLFSLQGHIGNTRKSLDERFPGTAGLMMQNLSEGITNGDLVLGWDLNQRRRFKF